MVQFVGNESVADCGVVLVRIPRSVGQEGVVPIPLRDRASEPLMKGLCGEVQHRFAKYDLRDAEVFRDLIQRGFVLTSDRDDVAAELGWVGLGHGHGHGHGDILPAETNLHRSGVNQTGASPMP